MATSLVACLCLTKPRIWKHGGKWMLQYFFRPRQCWLFGADVSERKMIAARCVSEIEFSSFHAAVDSLKRAYQCNQVNRW